MVRECRNVPQNERPSPRDGSTKGSGVPASPGHRTLLPLPVSGAHALQPQDPQPEPAARHGRAVGALAPAGLAARNAVSKALLFAAARRLCEGALLTLL